jgi:hypothetical protein
MKNLKQWKTSLLGLVSLIVAFSYLFLSESPDGWIFISLLIFGTLMLFSPDNLLSSLIKFIKTNEDKEL